MRAQRRLATQALALVVLLGLGGLVTTTQADDKEEKKNPFPGTYTDVNDPSLPVDFKYQGEYVGEIQGGDKLAAQVIALDKGEFQAVLLPGGLPGAGWEGPSKILLAGKLEEGKVDLQPATGKRKYLAQQPEDFSATSKFPPEGQKDYTGTITEGTLAGKTDDGKSFTLKKTTRQSPTLGQKAPEGALILFDGSNAAEWTAGRADNGILNTDGKDLRTKRLFNDYTIHLEFMEPYRPSARGQGRGNSGFFQVDIYEVQVLDSFGLDGKNNECGSIYSKIAPLVNMCLPPLQWQTYDVEFTNARRDNEGKISQRPRMTARQNGVLIHDNVEVPWTPGARKQSEEGTPGAIMLQGHGNPLQFKNIWIVEKNS